MIIRTMADVDGLQPVILVCAKCYTGRRLLIVVCVVQMFPNPDL